MSDKSDSTANMDHMSRIKVEHGRQMHQVLQVSQFYFKASYYVKVLIWHIELCEADITITPFHCESACYSTQQRS